MPYCRSSLPVGRSRHRILSWKDSGCGQRQCRSPGLRSHRDNCRGDVAFAAMATSIGGRRAARELAATVPQNNLASGTFAPNAPNITFPNQRPGRPCATPPFTAAWLRHITDSLSVPRLIKQTCVRPATVDRDDKHDRRMWRRLAGRLGGRPACASLGEVLRKYPRAPQNVKQGVEREQKRGHC